MMKRQAHISTILLFAALLLCLQQQRCYYCNAAAPSFVKRKKIELAIQRTSSNVQNAVSTSSALHGRKCKFSLGNDFTSLCRRGSHFLMYSLVLFFNIKFSFLEDNSASFSKITTVQNSSTSAAAEDIVWPFKTHCKKLSLFFRLFNFFLEAPKSNKVASRQKWRRWTLNQMDLFFKMK